MKITKQIKIRDVLVGGGAPIAVQSMTNTDTRDAQATLAQIRALADAGCDIVRCAVPDMQAAEALREICAGSPLPVVADIHFDYRLALAAIESRNLLTDDELRGARSVLRAAAMTYVAALLVSFAQLLRLILLYGNRRRD